MGLLPLGVMGPTLVEAPVNDPNAGDVEVANYESPGG